MRLASLWKELLAIWLATLVLSLCLLWIDLADQSFFWLIPVPTLRTIVPTALSLFEERPLTATALFALPAAAMLGTVVVALAHRGKSSHREASI